MEKYYDQIWINGYKYIILDENGEQVRTTRDDKEVERLTRVYEKWDPCLSLHENNTHVVGKWYIAGPFIKRESVIESVCRSVLK